MTAEMYHTGGADRSNEELAAQIKDEDNAAAALLLSQNEGFLSAEAVRLCEQYSLPDIADDLKQEGALALLAAAKRFDPSNGAKLLTYAAGAVRSAMLDYLARNALPVKLPTSRYYQLRRVSYLCTSAPEGSSIVELVDLISREMKVSPKVAGALLAEYRTMFGSVLLGDGVFSVSRGGDPAKSYDAYMRKKLLIKLITEALTPRELNVIRYHLGLDQPVEQEMTFAELAVRLNYNGPSAAEKVFQRAVKKLREHLYAGEYSVWVAASRAIHEAKRETQKYQGYVFPQTVWWERPS